MGWIIFVLLCGSFFLFVAGLFFGANNDDMAPVGIHFLFMGSILMAVFFGLVFKKGTGHVAVADRLRADQVYRVIGSVDDDKTVVILVKDYQGQTFAISVPEADKEVATAQTVRLQSGNEQVLVSADPPARVPQPEQPAK